jgi:5-formyltetrahydrofolate cyclo-ligase
VESKKELRSIVSERRDRLRQEDKDILDRAIFEKTISARWYLAAKTIFVYVSYKNEVDTHNIINYSLKAGKRVCVPKVISLREGMRAVEIASFSELRKGSLGILEPEYTEDRNISPMGIDLLLMPGVAFDRQGGRVGYGGGFYDRFLMKVRPGTPKIALSYSFQIFERVPMEEQDIRIDGLITD